MADDLALREERLREGFCPNCGIRLYKVSSGGIASKISIFKRKTKSHSNGDEHANSKSGAKMMPLSVAGLVERGQCLKCQVQESTSQEEVAKLDPNLGVFQVLPKSEPAVKAVPIEANPTVISVDEGGDELASDDSEEVATLKSPPEGDVVRNYPSSAIKYEEVANLKSPPEGDLIGMDELSTTETSGGAATRKCPPEAIFIGINSSDDVESAAVINNIHAAHAKSDNEISPLDDLTAPPKRSSTIDGSAIDSHFGDEGMTLDLCSIDLDSAPDHMHQYWRHSSHHSAGVASHATSSGNGAIEGDDDFDRKPPAKPTIDFEQFTEKIKKLRNEADATQQQIDLSFLERTTKKDPLASEQGYECPTGMSPEVFYQLPPEMQKEVTEQDKGKNGDDDREKDSTSYLDPETLASFPEHIRREVLEEARRKQAETSSPNTCSRPSMESFKPSGKRASNLSQSTTKFLENIEIDVAEFESYPEEIKNDIIAEKKRISSADLNALNDTLGYDDHDDDSDSDADRPSAYDQETLASLPEDVRREVLDQEKRARQERHRQKQTTKVSGKGSVGAYSVNIPAGYDPDTFAALPLDVQQELLDHAARMKRSSGVTYAAEGYDHDAILDAVVATARPASGHFTSCTYTGEYNSNGKRHGDGELNWANGDRYVGKFKDGFIEGRGTINFHDGTEYTGQWRKNRFHGDGTRRFKNGNVYTGNYVDGKRQGQGRCYFANGDMYVGDWKDDTIHGFGRYYYNNGHSFEGMFRNGKRNGRGKYQLTDGRVEIYRYVNDSRVGDGVRWSANRTKAWRMVDGKVKGRVSMEEATGIANKCGPVVETT